MPTKVVMPKLGESVVEGTITKWIVEEGDTVEEFEPLMEVNTDKVDTEIPSPASGRLLKILVPEGKTVDAGTLLAWIGEPGEEIPEGAEETVAETQPVGAEATVPEAPPAEETARVNVPPPGRDRDLGFISPVVARLAQEHNIDLYQIEGSGENGRITKQDVLSYIETAPEEPAPQAAAPWETPGTGELFRPTEESYAKPGPAAAPPPTAPPRPAGQPTDRLVSLTPMRKSIAQHMLHSKTTAPHVTTVMEANLQRVVAHHEANKAAFAADGVKLTYTAYFISALVTALKAYPIVNSSWSDEGVVLHPAINIGMAVSLGEDGLIVPVIQQADGYSLLGLARTINDLAERARSRRLAPDDVQGGTFSITNHGMGRSLFATPIINQPQAGILGVGMIQKRVVVIDDAIAIRPMVYLSLSFDHRILDGGSADHFLAKVVEALENWS